MSEFHRVCKASDIGDGESRMVLINGRRIGVFRVAGEYFALDDCCPHAGASLAKGYVEGDIVSCRIHHWRFCIRDGRFVDGNQPEHNVQAFPVRVVEGEVYVGVMAGE